MSSDEPLIVPLPENARVVTRWPIPIVVEPGAFVILGLAAVLGCAFSLVISITAGHDHPSAGDVALGVAVTMLWPVVMILHELGHAVAGVAVGRPPVWARAGLVPGVVLTLPPVERWARVLVSGARGPLSKPPLDCCSSWPVLSRAGCSSLPIPGRWSVASAF